MTEPNTAPASRLSQNQSLPFLSFTGIACTGSAARREAKVGVKTSRVVKEQRNIAKPITPTKLKASFHCQT